MAFYFSLTMVAGIGRLLNPVELLEFGIGDVCFLDWILISFILVSFGGFLSSISILAHICFLLDSCFLFKIHGQNLMLLE